MRQREPYQLRVNGLRAISSPPKVTTILEMVERAFTDSGTEQAKVDYGHCRRAEDDNMPARSATAAIRRTAAQSAFKPPSVSRRVAQCITGWWRGALAASGDRPGWLCPSWWQAPLSRSVGKFRSSAMAVVSLGLLDVARDPDGAP